MALATTYNTIGKREDLSDLISRVEPEETPLYSMLPKGPAPKQPYTEWQVDDLADPAFAGVNEGEDVSSFANKVVNRARIGNYIQIFRRAWAVSQLQELSDIAGVASEKANSKMKSALELRRDIEAAIASDNDRQAEDGVNPFKLRALGDWIDSAGPADVPAQYRTPSASINTTVTSSITEANFNAVIQSVYESNGMKGGYTLVCGPALKSAISGFTRATAATALTYQVNQDAESKKMTRSVDLYESDFGVVTIIPSLFNGRTSGGGLTSQAKARGYLLDMDLVSLNWMQGVSSKDLADEGGGPRGFVEAIVTLCVKNPKGLGKFAAAS